MLPQFNCGACGTPGCRQFAEKLLKGLVEASQCTVNFEEGNAEIARNLGIDAGVQGKRVARLVSVWAGTTLGYSGMQSSCDIIELTFCLELTDTAQGKPGNDKF